MDSVMRLRRLFTLTVILLCSLRIPTFGQQTRDISGRYPFLARIERLQRHEDVCILVNRTGGYRLERVFAAKTEVFIGSLSDAEISDLEHLLDSDELRSVSQSQIRSRLIVDNLDELRLAIFRSSGVQNIHFPDSSSRKAAGRAPDELVKWLQQIQKDQHAKLGEDQASRCMPPRNADAADGHTDQDTTIRPSAAEQPFLMRVVTIHSYGGVAERSCVVIKPTGEYHLEKTKQKISGNPNTDIFENTVGANEIKQLEALLLNPDLVKLDLPLNPQKLPAREVEYSVFMIPRENKIQQLAISSYFNVLANPADPAGMTNLKYAVELSAKLLAPVQDWVRNNIEKKKDRALKGTQYTGCGN